VNEHLEYFARLADRVTFTDLVHDAEFGELAHRVNNAVRAMAELLAERVQSGYEFETPPRTE